MKELSLQDYLILIEAVFYIVLIAFLPLIYKKSRLFWDRVFTLDK